jgi:hypothetical protein
LENAIKDGKRVFGGLFCIVIRELVLQDDTRLSRAGIIRCSIDLLYSCSSINEAAVINHNADQFMVNPSLTYSIILNLEMLPLLVLGGSWGELSRAIEEIHIETVCISKNE